MRLTSGANHLAARASAWSMPDASASASKGFCKQMSVGFTRRSANSLLVE